MLHVLSPINMASIPPELGISSDALANATVASHASSSPPASMPAPDSLKDLIAEPRSASPLPNVAQSLLPTIPPNNPPELGMLVLAATRASIALQPASRPVVFRFAQLSANVIKLGMSASMFAVRRAYISAFFSASFILNFPAKSCPRIPTRLATALADSSLKPSSPAKKP